MTTYNQMNGLRGLIKFILSADLDKKSEPNLEQKKKKLKKHF